MSVQKSKVESVKYIQSSTVMASEVGDQELVMMDADLATYFGLSSTGPAIWACFASPTTVDDAVSQLESTFQAPAGSIRADVEQLVNDLVRRKLLTAQPGPG